MMWRECKKQREKDRGEEREERGHKDAKEGEKMEAA